ncbi:hypothetical protein ACIBEJ_25190 [Nonomuraea sp. NPDC050790]|uniref:hypothetical protein n=1 Tax=Nonomuraea sp. NPDC050790 TaxID=3364371 RepID=UPI0037BD4666
MNTERLAFLENIEADLTARKPSEPSSRPTPAGKSRKLLRKLGMFGFMLAAAASFSVLNSTAANATPYCGIPNPIPRSHTKSCGLNFYSHDFIYSYPSGPGGLKECYVFWSTLHDFGCGADPGRETRICK